MYESSSCSVFWLTLSVVGLLNFSPLEGVKWYLSTIYLMAKDVEHLPISMPSCIFFTAKCPPKSFARF